MLIFPNGFAAGTKVMTSRCPVSIKDIKPGDIQVQPGDGKHDAHDDDDLPWWESN